MVRLRSDSALARTVVQSFLRFLEAVELAPDVDSEAVIVASQCLADAFGINVYELDRSVPDLAQILCEHGLDPSKSNKDAQGPKQPPQETVQTPMQGTEMGNDNETGLFDAKLFEHYREGLESAGYFEGLACHMPEYQERLKEAKAVFSEVLKRGAPSLASEHQVLAEAFKAQGNDSMTASRYVEAVDLYTMAISLCGDNAVYYSNRAAAHTQIGKYDEAIADCNKAIELDPAYSKAYSRLGLAYYTQGKYQEAIDKGFQRAYDLDPNSKSIQENLLAAQQKLKEEASHHHAGSGEQQQTQNRDQNAESRSSNTMPFNINLPQGMVNLFPAMFANIGSQFSREHGTTQEENGHGTNTSNLQANQQQQTANESQAPEATFSTTIPFNVPLPPGIENLFPGVSNISAQFGNSDQATPREGGVDAPTIDSQPSHEVRLDGSVNLTMDGSQLPPQFAGLMQSMLQMFAGAAAEQMGGPEQPNRHGNDGVSNEAQHPENSSSQGHE